MLVASELVKRVRLLAFNPSTTLISDEDVESIIQGWIDMWGTDDKYLCKVLWNSLLSLLQFLWNTDIINHNTSTGGATSRTEKVGQVMVTVEYGDSSSDYSSPWEDIYNRYLNGELQIPNCPLGNGAGSKILIGGVSQKEINRVNSNPDSVNGLGCVGSVDRHTQNIKYGRRSGYNTLFIKRGG